MIDEPRCNPHPKAPHGFNRNASHSAHRYVCDCEGWDPYAAGYSDGFHAGMEAEQAQQPRKAVKLTPDEVAAIVKEAAKGGPLRRDGSTSERIARVIEQAVWEKLGLTE